MATTSGQRGDTRAAKRRSTHTASTIRVPGSGPIDVMVLDVSATGVRIVTPALLQIGQEISIGLAGAGVTRAFVVRGDRGQYGCAFEAPMATEDAARAFSTAPVVRLGQRTPAPRVAESADLRELYLHHRFWQMPLDAVLMGATLMSAAAYGAWWLAR